MMATAYDDLCRMPRDELVAMVERLEFAVAEMLVEPDVLADFLLPGARLTVREARLLGLLVGRCGTLMDRDAIMAAVYFDRGEWPDQKGIDVLVHHLRRKIDPAKVTVRTFHGHGYLAELHHERTEHEEA